VLQQEQVALFGSWGMFHLIGEQQPGSIVRNYDGPDNTARMSDLSALQFEMLSRWAEERHDSITFANGVEYMRQAHPRVTHIAFDETDDWAHDRKYNRVLNATIWIVRCKIWQAVNDSPEYCGKPR
jgi:hypothetical protein